jgi:hypothetical protein
MAGEIEFIVKESEEGGYEATALCHCICTQADSIEDLKGAIRDAVCCHFDEGDLPDAILVRLGDDSVISL